MPKRRRWMLEPAAILVAVCLSRCATSQVTARPDNGGRSDRVVLQLKWLHQFQFAGFYAAQLRGFYRNAGLAITIIEGEPDREPLTSLTSGQADFAISDGADGLLARLRGQPVVACAVIMQHSPNVIMTREGTGIRQPRDLVGRKVMINRLPSDTPGQALMFQSGISLSAVHLVPHTGDVDDLAKGRVDAMTAYATMDEVRLLRLGIKPVYLRPIDYGIDFYGDTIFTSTRMAADRFDVVNRFRMASMKGWDYAMDHPAELADAILAMRGVRERGVTRADLLAEARRMRSYIIPGLVEPGHMNPRRWDHMAATLADLKLVRRPYSLAGFLVPTQVEERARLSDTLIRIVVIVAAIALVILLWAMTLRRAVALRTADLRAEMRIREQRETEAAHLASFLRSNPNPVVEVSPAGELIYVNPAAERALPGLREAGGEHPFLRFTADEIARLDRGQIIAGREVTVDGCWYQQSLFFEPQRRVVRVYALDVSERKRAEEDLRESEQRMASTLEAAEIGAWEWCPIDGRSVWSDSLYRLFGFEPRSVAPNTELFEQHLHPDERAPMAARIAQALEVGGTFDDEYRYVWPDGTIRWMHTRGSIVKDEQGRAERMLGIVRDVTLRRRAVDDLRLSKQLLALHVRHTPLAVVEWDTDFLVREWNPGAERIFGYTEAEAKGRGGPDLIVPEEAREHVGTVWAELITREGGSRSRNMNVTRDGRRITCEWYNTPLVDDDGKVIGVASLVQDVTDQLRAEEELRESRARLLNVLNSVPMILFAMDGNGRMVFAEGKGLEVLDLEPEDVIGESVIGAYDADPGLSEAHERAMAGESVSLQLRLREVERIYELQLAPTHDSTGKVVGATGVALDITEAKSTEAQLQQAQKMETVGRLAGGIAHDFNNLLTAILGYADLAYDIIPTDNPSHSYVQQIRSAAERASELTRKLLAFARREIVSPKVIDLPRLILDVEPMLQRVIGDDISVITKSAPDLWPVVIDPGQMEQVLVNLAVNSRDAMPDGGRLTICAKNVVLDTADAHHNAEVTPGDYVVLEVADTGVGMTEDVRARAFEPFFTTKEVGRGTGLGLSTCHGIVRQAGGHITLTGELGHGTTARVYLPRASGNKTAKYNRASEAAPRGTERVLLVEDDPLVRDMAVSALTGLGYCVIAADSGAIALRMLGDAAAEFDLMITDVVMPDLGGRDLARQVATIRPNLKVLFVSGYTEDAAVRRGVLDEGVEFLGKPFSPAGLARKVRSVIDGAGD